MTSNDHATRGAELDRPLRFSLDLLAISSSCPVLASFKLDLPSIFVEPVVEHEACESCWQQKWSGLANMTCMFFSLRLLLQLLRALPRWHFPARDRPLRFSLDLLAISSSCPVLASFKLDLPSIFVEPVVEHEACESCWQQKWSGLANMFKVFITVTCRSFSGQPGQTCMCFFFTWHVCHSGMPFIFETAMPNLHVVFPLHGMYATVTCHSFSR